jgi:DNA-binding response OmpR family regulator
MDAQKGRILLAEDETDSRDFFTFLLSECGYEVISASNCETAINYAKDQSFDLYITELWLPKVSGLELIKRLREFDKITPVLVCSGGVYESDAKNAYEAGAHTYLSKPVDPDRLLAEVRKLIEERRTRT